MACEIQNFYYTTNCATIYTTNTESFLFGLFGFYFDDKKNKSIKVKEKNINLSI